MTRTLPVARGSWQGAADILHYNWPAYAAAAVAALLLLAAAAWLGLPIAARALLLAAGAAVLAAAALSLLVSHWVYDRSELHSWSWLTRRVPSVRSWAVVHAGLDEASPALAALYPGASGISLDVYDPARMTEPAIRVARASATRTTVRSVQASFQDLRLPPGSQDLVLLFFSAHELRQPGDRAALLRQVASAIGPRGRVVVVEHLRDLPNLVAFNVGAFHFFGRRDWLRRFGEAGLRVAEEHAITPFVRAFHLGAEAAP